VRIFVLWFVGVSRAVRDEVNRQPIAMDAAMKRRPDKKLRQPPQSAASARILGILNGYIYTSNVPALCAWSVCLSLLSPHF